MNLNQYVFAVNRMDNSANVTVSNYGEGYVMLDQFGKVTDVYVGDQLVLTDFVYDGIPESFFQIPGGCIPMAGQ
mgnify:CR=1 FL=1